MSHSRVLSALRSSNSRVLTHTCYCIVDNTTTPAISTMARTRKASAQATPKEDFDVEERPAKKPKLEATTAISSQNATEAVPNKKGKAKSDDFPQRVSSPWKVGAHVSSAGGVENSIVNAAEIGANAFSLFIKSQRKWTSPPLKETSISMFKERMKEYGYAPRHILPHGSYLINLGNPDIEKREKSYECFLDDLRRCEQLGLAVYNFHPGSTVGAITTLSAISLIARCINRAHKATDSVITVLENMAGAGNIIGSDFAHLAGIISEVEDKSRVGVCLDTCHMFAAGYDIRTKDGWDATLTDFDTQVGLSYLRGMHLNDSKTPLNSKRDRHENIGLGHMGLPTFHHILTDKRVQNLPLILETPSFEKPEVWATELEVLNRLSNLVVVESASDNDEMVNVIKETVKKAGGSTAAKGKSTVGRVKRGKQKQKQEQKVAGEDLEDEAEGHNH